MTAPHVTVLIDTYNYGRFIEEAIKSVVSQDFPPEEMEILVVDDGSTDDTPERVKKYASRIRYLRKENGGQASAFNLGFAKAQGEIVILLDADDYFLPGKVRRVVEEFRKNTEAGMVYHPLSEFDTESGRFRDGRFSAVSGCITEDRGKLLRYEPYSTSCLAFRREVALRILPIPPSIKIQADGYLTFLMPLIAPIVALPETLAVYRIHGRNQFYEKKEAANAERMLRRHQMFGKILCEVRQWVAEHQDVVNAREARIFLRRWPLCWEEELFAVQPPNRLRYFSFLLRQNHSQRFLQTWKYTVFNYLSAPLALVLGYSGAQSANEKALRSLQGMFGR